MKKHYYFNHILLILACAFLFFQVNAQNFAVDGNKVLYGSVVADNNPADFTIYINNTTNPQGPLILSWDSVSSSFPAGWIWTLCDKGECFNGLPGSLPQTMDTVQPGQKGFFKLSVQAETLDSAVLKLAVFEDGTSTPKDTVEFHISSTPVGIKKKATADVVLSVSPNPAKDILSLSLKNTHLKIRTAQVFDILGNSVMTIDSKADFNKIPISTLQSGVYIIRMMDQEGNYYSRRFYKAN